jgi:hypothetical protein
MTGRVSFLRAAIVSYQGPGSMIQVIRMLQIFFRKFWWLRACFTWYIEEYMHGQWWAWRDESVVRGWKRNVDKMWSRDQCSGLILPHTCTIMAFYTLLASRDARSRKFMTHGSSATGSNEED